MMSTRTSPGASDLTSDAPSLNERASDMMDIAGEGPGLYVIWSRSCGSGPGDGVRMREAPNPPDAGNGRNVRSRAWGL